jgi:hypothetical protein
MGFFRQLESLAVEEAAAYPEFEVVPPLHGATITLDVSAADMELALESYGENLRPALMAALYAALSVDSDNELNSLTHSTASRRAHS